MSCLWTVFLSTEHIQDREPSSDVLNVLKEKRYLKCKILSARLRKSEKPGINTLLV